MINRTFHNLTSKSSAALIIAQLCLTGACTPTPHEALLALDEDAPIEAIEATGVALCRAGDLTQAVAAVTAQPSRARAEAVIAAARCARLERAEGLCAPATCQIATTPEALETIRRMETIRRARGATAPAWGALDVEARLTLTIEAPVASGWPPSVHQAALRQLASALYTETEMATEATPTLLRTRWCEVYGPRHARTTASPELWAEGAHTGLAAGCKNTPQIIDAIKSAAAPGAPLRALLLTGDPAHTTLHAALWRDLLAARWSCAQRRQIGMVAATLASIAPQVHAHLDAEVWHQHHAQLALTCAQAPSAPTGHLPH